jgi:hypothetical protein
MLQCRKHSILAYGVEKYSTATYLLGNLQGDAFYPIEVEE